MWFAIYCEDVPDSLEKRLETRTAHLENLQKLVDQNRVLLAGPFPKAAGGNPAEVGFDGSLIIADFPTQEAAQAWIDQDPYVLAGVFESIQVRPFHQVFPKPTG